MNKILIPLLIITATTAAKAQQNSDTVIVELAKTSKVIFTIQDKNDLEILKHYDFQKLFTDVLLQLEQKNSNVSIDSITAKKENQISGNDKAKQNDSTNAHDNDGDHWRWHREHNMWGRTWQSFNCDLGLNNYIDNSKSLDHRANYVVRPWGSWYVAINSIQRSRVDKNFFLEWGLGLSWYNFKFQNKSTLINKTIDGVLFENDLRDVEFVKSKLSVTYLSVSLIPIIDFRDDEVKHRKSDGGSNSFRIGLGPYAGYRLGSHSKLEYREDGHREKDKNHDNFYLNNFRYGARLQIGFRSTDLFFNYDLNNLFIAGNGPELNAFSFGVVF